MTATDPPLCLAPAERDRLAARDALVRQYLPLAYKVVRTLGRGGWLDRADLRAVESAALAGLCRAADRWRPEGGASFKTFAYNGVRFACLSAAAQSRREWPLVQLTDDLAETLYVAPAETPLEDAEERAALAEARRFLPPRERQAVAWRYDEGLTLAAIGGRLGVTRERARQILHAAHARLRRRLEAA